MHGLELLIIISLNDVISYLNDVISISRILHQKVSVTVVVSQNNMSEWRCFSKLMTSLNSSMVNGTLIYSWSY